MSHVIKIASNTVYQLIAKVFSVSTTVVATALITRSLGVASFGAFFLMTGFATYFFLLVDFGINAVAAREISRETKDTPLYFQNVLSLRLAYSVALTLLLIAVLPLIPFRLPGIGYLRLGIAVGLLALVSQAVYNTCTIVFQSRLTYGRTIVASAVGNLTFLLLAFWVILSSGNLLFLVLANTFGSFLVSLTALILVIKFVGKIKLSFDLRLWQRLIMAAFPLGITIFLTVVVSKADSFLLSVMDLSRLKMTNAFALGSYGLAYKVFENVLVFPTYFVNALFPVLVRHEREGLLKIRRTLGSSLLFMIAVSLFGVLLGYVTAPFIIYVLAGLGSTSQVVLALRLLLLGLPFFFCSAVLMFFLIAAGQERKLPGVYLTAVVFNVLLNIIFIPRYGFVASAVITGVTEFLILVGLSLVSLFYFSEATRNENL